MYYEKYKIMTVEDGVDGNKRVRLQIPDSDDIVIDVPEWELEAVQTEEPSDATETRNTRANIIVDELYEILKAKNVRFEDISFITQKLLTKLQGIEEDGTNKLLGVGNRYEIRIGHYDK